MNGDETNKHFGPIKDPVASNTGKEWLGRLSPIEWFQTLRDGNLCCHPCEHTALVHARELYEEAHKRIAELEIEIQEDYFNSGETIARYVRQIDAADIKIASLESSLEGMKKERDKIQSKLDLMCHDQVKRLESYEELFKSKVELELQSETARREFAKEIESQRKFFTTKINELKNRIKNGTKERQRYRKDLENYLFNSSQPRASALSQAKKAAARTNPGI